MSLEFKGTIEVINDTQVISDKFQKREFVINDGSEYPQSVAFELTQTNCDELDKYVEGQEVTVHFNLRGRRWEKDGKVRFFNTLQAWKIESEAKPKAKAKSKKEAVTEKDDLPF